MYHRRRIKGSALQQKGKEIIMTVELAKFIFAIYILALLGVTLFPIQINVRGQSIHTYGIPVNYVPLKSIINDIAAVGHGHFSTQFQIKLLIRNVGGNFILLMPLGILLPLLWRKINSIKKVLVFGFAVSLSIEMLQLLEGTLCFCNICNFKFQK